MRLLRPASVEEAVQALREDEWGAKVVAGGTAVVLMMQQNLIAPEVLVSLRRIPGLEGVGEEDGAVAIGARTTLRDVAASDLVRRRYPSLADACQRVGNVRIRNAATLGGNLAEADYASDPPAVLVALGAGVRITGPDGVRESLVEDLLAGFYATTLEPAEVITAITLPPRDPARARDVYLKYISRSSEDRPCVGVAASARFSADEPTAVDEIRVVVGAAAATPQRFPEVEAEVTGRRLDEATIDRVADGYADLVEPIEDLRGTAWYRKQMVRVFTRRALRAVAGSAEA